MSERIVVTGAGGFIGQRAVESLAASGAIVTALARTETPVADWPAHIAAALPDVLIHCAGAASVGTSMSDPATDYAAGPALLFDVLNAVRIHAPHCRVLFCSSAAVYGDPATLPIDETQPLAPLSPYGFHKWQSEVLLREFSAIYGIPTAALRIFSAYGPGLKRQVIWDICRKVVSGAPLALHGTGRESRDFVHVDDVVQAIRIVAASARMAGEAYNVAAGRETCIADLAAIITHLDGSNTAITFDGAETPGNPVRWHANVSRLSALGFKPTISLEDGLRSVLDNARRT